MTPRIAAPAGQGQAVAREELARVTAVADPRSAAPLAAAFSQRASRLAGRAFPSPRPCAPPWSVL